MKMDPRFNMVLLAEVFDLLERHGYSQPTTDRPRYISTARCLMALGDLIEAFEGRDA